MEYDCSKCGTIVHSEKKLEFCICGCKYAERLFQEIHDIFSGVTTDKTFGIPYWVG